MLFCVILRTNAVGRGARDLEADVWKRHPGPCEGLWKLRLGVWVPEAKGLRGWVMGLGTRNGGQTPG